MEKKEFLDVSELDVMEESIWKYDSSILRRLLQDIPLPSGTRL